MWAALIAVRGQHPRRLILAVPVAPPEPLALLAPLVDEEICSVRPEHMQAVGAWYEDFSQTTAAEVAGLLAELGGSLDAECPRLEQGHLKQRDRMGGKIPQEITCSTWTVQVVVPTLSGRE